MYNTEYTEGLFLVLSQSEKLSLKQKFDILGE